MLDVLIALALLALGYRLGRQHRPAVKAPPAPREQELQQLLEDRAAFSRLMGYNAGQAYGQDDS